MYQLAGLPVSFLAFSVMTGDYALYMQDRYILPLHTIEIIALAFCKVNNWQDIVTYL